MKIWVDADACPGVVKEILYRVAERTQVEVTLVANQLLRVPPSKYVRALQVPAGFDVADREIVRLYYLEGRTYEEISTETDVPVNTIGAVLSRARKKLREISLKGRKPWRSSP